MSATEDFLDGPGPTLLKHAPDRPPRGVLLVLHGGTQHSTVPVTSGSGSLRRMMWLERAIRHRVLRAGYASWLLRYEVRGWNAELGEPSPVVDTRWALDQVRAAYPDVPVVVLGHSMGGRTAARVADDPSVSGVVGLAPWFEQSDRAGPLAGRNLVVGHGQRDRITSARMSRRFVTQARAVASSAEFHSLGLAGHYLLYRPGRWHRFALRHSLDLLDRATVSSPAS